jgi:hypothetical protein
MPMTVKGPNGVVIDFPDGTDPQTIDRVMRRAVGQRSGGATPQAAPSDPAQPPDPYDVLKSIGSGAVRGVAAVGGLAGDWAKVGGTALGRAGRRLGLPDPPRLNPTLERGLHKLLPTSAELTGAVERNITGPLHEPQTTPGKYAGTIAAGAPALVGGPAALGRRALSVLGGGALSEAGGQATEGTPLEPYARAAGATFGGWAAPAATRRAVTPFPGPREREDMVRTLQQAGVRSLTPGMRSGHPRLQAFEQELGGHQFVQRQDQIRDQFTSAVLRPAGIRANRATTRVVNDAFTNIGREFDTLQSGTTARLDRPLGNELARIPHDYEMTHGAPAAGVQRMAQRIRSVAAVNGGTIPGRSYQAIRTDISRLADMADPDTARAFRRLQEAMDDSVERAMTPRLRTQWQDARQRYRNLLVVRRAVGAGSGVPGAAGHITPSQLAQADQMVFGEGAYTRGRSTYSDLAHAGKVVLDLPPRSGTVERAAVRAIPAALAGGAAHLASGTLPLSGLAAAAAPYALGKVAMAPGLTPLIGNQAWRPPLPGTDFRQAARLGALYGPRQFLPPGPPSNEP